MLTQTLVPHLVGTMGTATVEFGDDRETFAQAFEQLAQFLKENEDVTLVAVTLGDTFVEFVFDGLEQISYFC